jgi:hypothetical protein
MHHGGGAAALTKLGLTSPLSHAKCLKMTMDGLFYSSTFFFVTGFPNNYYRITRYCGKPLTLPATIIATLTIKVLLDSSMPSNLPS